MPSHVALPDALIARFRAVALERLERVDASWVALTHGGAAPQAEDEMFRDLHTLKGDARVIGYAEVAMLCQRLEDVLAAARRRHYRVHDDVDIVVTMAVQFIGMMLRKKGGDRRQGIDLDGFLSQMEDVVTEWLRRSSEAPERSVSVSGRFRISDMPQRLSPNARHRLSALATRVHLESARASGRARERLREVWRGLSREVAELDAAPLAPIFSRHASAAKELARALEKSVDVHVTDSDVRVGAEVLDAVSVAVLHALRNAVDHGIEPLGDRVRHGKPPIGTISLSAAMKEENVEVVVRDDGGGVDLEKVRARAVARGVVTADAAPKVSDAELVEMLFASGFSTADSITEVSGRGIGLDAVRASARRLGGTVTIASAAGEGSAMTIALPQARSVVDVRVLRVPGAQVQFCVGVDWETSAGTAVAGEPSIDLCDVFELGPRADSAPSSASGAGVRLQRGDARLFVANAIVAESTIARRACATALDEPGEVVAIDGEELLLVRPDVLLAAAVAAAESQA
jgi:two-component system chemotaxis sensor kinase CheA